MNRQIYTRQTSGTSSTTNTFASVSLSPTPGIDITPDRSETTPRTPMIRNGYTPGPLRGIAAKKRADRAVDEVARKIASLGIVREVKL